MVKLEKSNGELGFTSSHTFITNPKLSECGRFEVDPIKHYGLTQEQLMILAFGEEFMASDDKGTLKEYRGGMWQQ